MPPEKEYDSSGSSDAGVRNERSIGTILIQAGRLTFEDAERILRLQHERNIRFGDAAIELGLLTQTDIDFALARQFELPYLVAGESRVSPEVVCAYAPFSPRAMVMGSLRSQLMLRWFDAGPTNRSLAVLSADRHEGRSYIAANLAVSFSQLGLNTLLIDADFRNPRQHLLFGLQTRGGLSSILSGRGGLDDVSGIPGLPNLSVLPTGAIPPNPLEILARPAFPQLLSELSNDFPIILLDAPSAAECPDAQIIAVRAGAAIIVTRKNASRVWRVRGVSDAVTHASATVIGSILNDF